MGNTDTAAIVRLTMAYTQSKILHSAVEVGLFELLAEGPATATEIRDRLDLHPRLLRDFLNALVALGLLEREDGHFRNSPAAAEVLVPGGPVYLGARIRTASQRHYAMWGRLSEALRDGKPTGHTAFDKLYENPAAAKNFLVHMDANNAVVAPQLAEVVDWSRYTSFVDVGGARGNVAARLVLAHPHLRGGVMELPGIEPLFHELMAELDVTGKVDFHAGDFFADPMPETDVIVFGHVLHDWDTAGCQQLLERAYAAIRPGGAVVVYDQMLDEQSPDLRSLIGSINVALITEGGGEYTVAEGRAMVEKAGFTFQAATKLAEGNDTVLVATR
ncbi:methyltransferase [Kutzneria sp. NPDC052558]|uniref:methyltransferase n=1 Tax=Kutzneria sp. NPDC052558 TaxID=3364121 RepID=UPI0037CBCDA4